MVQLVWFIRHKDFRPLLRQLLVEMHLIIILWDLISVLNFKCFHFLSFSLNRLQPSSIIFSLIRPLDLWGFFTESAPLFEMLIYQFDSFRISWLFFLLNNYLYFKSWWLGSLSLPLLECWIYKYIYSGRICPPEQAEVWC